MERGGKDIPSGVRLRGWCYSSSKCVALELVSGLFSKAQVRGGTTQLDRTGNCVRKLRSEICAQQERS
jgi:hypothetical protein